MFLTIKRVKYWKISQEKVVESISLKDVNLFLRAAFFFFLGFSKLL